MYAVRIPLSRRRWPIVCTSADSATEFVQHPGEFLHADGDLFGDRCASAIPVNAESRALQQVGQQPRMDSRGMLFEFLFRHIATPRIAPGLLLVQSFSALATASQVSS